MGEVKSCDLLEFTKTVYPTLKPDVRDRTVTGYAGVVNQFYQFLGKRILVGEIDEEMILKFLHDRLKVQKRSAYTCNGDRATLMALWEEAFEHNYHYRPPQRRRVRKLKEPTRISLAWSQEELERLLEACKRAKPVPRRCKWTRNHFVAEQWIALVLIIYDTAHRIGTILSVRRDQYRDGLLTVEAEQTKQNRDIVHRLHPQTIAAIEEMPDQETQVPEEEMLIGWPLKTRSIYFYYRKILITAGLPATKKDMFHKIRRMSYTAVAAEKGIEAATRHAGHSQDLSKYYLDPTKMNPLFAADYLPRPQFEPANSTVQNEMPQAAGPEPFPTVLAPDAPVVPDVPISPVPEVLLPEVPVVPDPVVPVPPAPVVEPTTTPQSTPAVSLPTEPRNGDRDVLSQFQFEIDTTGF